MVTRVALAGAQVAGGGAGGTSTPAAPATDRVARFIDAHVEGLAFKSARRSGLTDRNGNSPCAPGETISFSIGNMVLDGIAPTGWCWRPALNSTRPMA